MTPAHHTSLLVTSELRANRVGPRGVDVGMSALLNRGTRTTPENTSLTHTFSVPVVREMPPRQASFLQTW